MSLPEDINKKDFKKWWQKTGMLGAFEDMPEKWKEKFLKKYRKSLPKKK